MKITHPPGATPLDADEMAALVPTSISTQEELNAFEQANILDAELWALGRKRADVIKACPDPATSATKRAACRS